MPRKPSNPLTADPTTTGTVHSDTAMTAAPVRPAPRPRARRKTAIKPLSTTVAIDPSATTTHVDATTILADPDATGGLLGSVQPQVDADSATSPQTIETEPLSATEHAGAKPPFTPADGILKAPKPGTKQALVVDFLSREAGATVTELQAATGWLPHTTRAALTGLRQRGHVLAASKADGVRRYRILTPCSPPTDNGVSSSSDATSTEAGQ